MVKGQLDKIGQVRLRRRGGAAARRQRRRADQCVRAGAAGEAAHARPGSQAAAAAGAGVTGVAAQRRGFLCARPGSGAAAPSPRRAGRGRPAQRQSQPPRPRAPRRLPEGYCPAADRRSPPGPTRRGRACPGSPPSAATRPYMPALHGHGMRTPRAAGSAVSCVAGGPPLGGSELRMRRSGRPDRPRRGVDGQGSRQRRTRSSLLRPSSSKLPLWEPGRGGHLLATSLERAGPAVIAGGSPDRTGQLPAERRRSAAPGCRRGSIGRRPSQALGDRGGCPADEQQRGTRLQVGAAAGAGLETSAEVWPWRVAFLTRAGVQSCPPQVPWLPAKSGRRATCPGQAPSFQPCWAPSSSGLRVLSTAGASG